MAGTVLGVATAVSNIVVVDMSVFSFLKLTLKNIIHPSFLLSSAAAAMGLFPFIYDGINK